MFSCDHFDYVISKYFGIHTGWSASRSAPYKRTLFEHWSKSLIRLGNQGVSSTSTKIKKKWQMIYLAEKNNDFYQKQTKKKNFLALFKPLVCFIGFGFLIILFANEFCNFLAGKSLSQLFVRLNIGSNSFWSVVS